MRHRRRRTELCRSFSSRCDPNSTVFWDVRLTTDIENVFLNKPGPHLRHVFAHGLLHDGVPYSHDVTYACWLIYRLAVLPLVSDRERLGISDEWFPRGLTTADLRVTGRDAHIWP